MNKKGAVIRIKKKTLLTWVIIVGIVALGIILISIHSNANSGIVSASLAQCIGQHSKLYVQYGCPHCADQEAMFGGNLKYLNYTDCFQQENRQQCINANITAVPTWIINGQRYLGVQSIPTLQNLTGC